MADSDSELAADLKAGSGYALKQLLDRYGDRLYSFALKRLGDRQDAFTALDDTFLQVVKRIESFQVGDAEGGFRGWVFRICQNKVIDMLRKRSASAKDRILVRIDADLEDSGEGLTSGQKQVDRKIAESWASKTVGTIVEDSADLRARILSECIAKLTDRDRTILECCANGMPHKQVAELLRIPQAHVKTYYARIKKRVRDVILAKVGESGHG